jgi:uncharacterized membrane protein YdbT with pleckstrin-like domain
VTTWTDPIPDARRAGWRVPFGQRLLRVETAGGVRWLTPAQAGMDAATIAAIEAAEAEGDRRAARQERSA